MAKYEDIAGKKVIVTGGASGIGLATVERFISEGAQVIVIDKNQKTLDSLTKNNSGVVAGICADVSSDNQIKDAFREAETILGGIDILIANAGISVRQSFLNISFEQWKKVLGVNLDGVFLCCQEAIKRMEVQKQGVILITASTNGMQGHKFYADYNSSKAGVILLMKTIALEFAPWLRINAICPGYVLTPMQQAEYTLEMLEEVNSSIPLKRHANPEEIASLFLFLASKEASYITGQCIVIDGGETA